MKMTLMDLQDQLAKQIELLSDDTIPYEERKKQADISQTISSLAKQMINNSDVMLRTEKLAAEGKLAKEAIQRIIG